MHVHAMTLHLWDRSTEFGSMDWVEFCAMTMAANRDAAKIDERRERMMELVKLGCPSLSYV